MPFFVVLLSVLISATAFAKTQKFEMSIEQYQAGQVVTVPAGNLNSAQRDYDRGAYENVLWIIAKAENACVIKQAAAAYQVDPVAIMGSIVGEHTFNVDVWDITQETYVYMAKKWIGRFNNNGIDLADMLQEENYKSCEGATSNNYELWNCYNSYWKTDKRNDRRNQGNWELKWTFFNPMGAGYTYGFGQLGPERALMVTDLVSERSGFEELSILNPEGLYDAILNPQTSIHYVAATNRIAIDTYMRVANFDISQNMGIIATLYNLGKEVEKAANLYDKTVNSLSQNGSANYPEVNTYGWFINSKEEEMRAVYNKSISENCP